MAQEPRLLWHTNPEFYFVGTVVVFNILVSLEKDPINIQRNSLKHSLVTRERLKMGNFAQRNYAQNFYFKTKMVANKARNIPKLFKPSLVAYLSIQQISPALALPKKCHHEFKHHEFKHKVIHKENLQAFQKYPLGKFHGQLWKTLSGTTSEKRGVPSRTEGERTLKMLWRLQMHWIIGLGGSQLYSWGEFQEKSWERFRGLSLIFPEFLPESPSRTGVWPSIAPRYQLRSFI